MSAAVSKEGSTISELIGITSRWGEHRPSVISRLFVYVGREIARSRWLELQSGCLHACSSDSDQLRCVTQLFLHASLLLFLVAETRRGKNPRSARFRLHSALPPWLQHNSRCIRTVVPMIYSTIKHSATLTFFDKAREILPAYRNPLNGCFS